MVTTLAWSADSARLASDSWVYGSDHLLIWDTQRWIQMHTLDAPTELVNDGRLLASCGDDGAIQIRRMETGDPVTNLRRDRPYERFDITGIKGVTDGQKLALKLMGAVEHLSSDATVINIR